MRSYQYDITRVKERNKEYPSSDGYKGSIWASSDKEAVDRMVARMGTHARKLLTMDHFRVHLWYYDGYPLVAVYHGVDYKKYL